MRKNDHWCNICRLPIQAKPHIHCNYCAAPPSMIKIIEDRLNGNWDSPTKTYIKCERCNKKWEVS